MTRGMTSYFIVIVPIDYKLTFHFLSSNISSVPAYRFYISQLVRYAKAHLSLMLEPVANVKTLSIEDSCSPIMLSQGYRRAKLVSTFKQVLWETS